MTVTNLQLFQILKEKLGETQAETLVTYVDAKVQDEFESHKENLATKLDISNLKEDIAVLKGELKNDILNSQNKIILWTIGTMFIMFGLALTIYKLLH